MKRCWGVLVLVLFVGAAVIAPTALAAGRPVLGVRPTLHTRPLMGTVTTSQNWSGYDVAGGPFTTVTATWTQPKARASGSTFSDTAFWVGIDGDGSGTVEQIGTEGYNEGVTGYDAWYEMFPDAPVTTGMAVHAGDVITATVTLTPPATFTLSLVNHTTAESFSTTQLMATPPALASAEIIAEAPSSGSGIVRLNDFTQCDFRGCAIDGQPLGAYDWNRIDMVSASGRRLDRTLSLGADAASFTVSTDVTPPVTIAHGAASVWHHSAVRLTFTASDVGTGVASTQLSTDGGATYTAGQSLVIAALLDHSADGVHRVRYRSIDNAGNVEPHRVVRVGVDTQAPTPSASPARVGRGRTATLRYRIDDPRPGSPNATVRLTIRNARGKAVRHAVLQRQAVDTGLRYSFVCRLAKGRYTYEVDATDAAGNAQTVPAKTTLVVH
jgi:hypothetical protein